MSTSRGFDRVNGEGLLNLGATTDDPFRNQTHFPFDIPVGERNGFGEVPEGPVQLSGVATAVPSL